MSLVARIRLSKHANLFATDRNTVDLDIMKVPQPGQLYAGMQSPAIALMLDLLDKGFIFQVTMGQTGHHNDGPNGHAGGCGWDGWPLNSRRLADWMHAPSSRFDEFAYAFSNNPFARQWGAVGDGSDDPETFHYAAKGFIARGVYVPGFSTFEDSGGAHVHLGSVGG